MMGSFSIWHWLIVILIIASPAIVVATERSDKRSSRGKFAIALVIMFAVLSLRDIFYLFLDIDPSSVSGIFTLASIITAIWFYRVIVQRVRDAGFSKKIAYLSCIPIINLAFFLYLLFPGSKADAPTIQAFE
jgi:hypothetical protein